MDFDRATSKFRNKAELYRDPMLYPSWPFFLPDVVRQAEENSADFGRRVVFALVSNNDLVTGAIAFSFTPPTGNLGWVDLNTKTPAALDRANGATRGESSSRITSALREHVHGRLR